MNTRRYPRTADEAFKGADYASSITQFGKRSNGDTAVTWACALGLVFLVGMLIVEAL